MLIPGIMLHVPRVFWMFLWRMNNESNSRHRFVYFYVSIQIWNNISFIHKLEFLIVNTKSSKIIVNTNGS